MRTVIIPEQNVPDLEEIDPTVRESIEFIPVSNASRVLDVALADDALSLPGMTMSHLETVPDALPNIPHVTHNTVNGDHYGA